MLVLKNLLRTSLLLTVLTGIQAKATTCSIELTNFVITDTGSFSIPGGIFALINSTVANVDREEDRNSKKFSPVKWSSQSEFFLNLSNDPSYSTYTLTEKASHDSIGRIQVDSTGPLLKISYSGSKNSEQISDGQILLDSESNQAVISLVDCGHRDLI